MLLRNILLTVGVVAILIGVGLGVFLLVRPGPVHQPSAVAEQMEALVAARPIHPGDLLREGDVTWRPIDAKSAPSGLLAKGRISELALVGAIARQSYAPGELIMPGGFLGANDRSFLAAVLAPGDRAVTITVNAAQSASGLILAGDRIDVIMVQGPGNASDADARRTSVAQTLLRDVRVIAVGRSYERAGAQASLDSASPPSKPAATSTAPLPDTLTLELSPKDAERLYVAMEIGRVELSLRALASGVDTTGGGDVGAVTADVPVWASDIAPAGAQARPPLQPILSRGPSPVRARATGDGGPDSSIRIIRATGASNP